MRSRLRMIAIAAFAIFLMPVFLLHAGEAAAQTSTASPYASGQYIGTPRAELFLGYSYLRAVPAPAAGNRLMWMNGGSTSLALNFNRYLGIVGDFGAYTNSQMRFQGGYAGTVDVDNENVGAFSYLFGPRISFRNHS